MATISTTLELVDNISGRLAAIGGRVQGLADRFGVLDEAVSSVQARLEKLSWNVPEVDMPELDEPELTEALKVQLQPVLAALPETDFEPLEQKIVYTAFELPELRSTDYVDVQLDAPEIVVPELAAPELHVPEIVVPELAAPELHVPEIVVPELAAPELHMPEIVAPGFAVPELAAVKIAAPEIVVGALHVPELHAPEINVPAAEGPDFGMTDADSYAQGLRMMQGVAFGVQAGRGMVDAAMEGVCAAVLQAVRYGLRQATELGANFASGMAAGIRSRMGAVASAARATADAAAVAARAALKIHSPSRVTQQIGAYYGEGFADGIVDSGKSAAEAAGRLSRLAYRELRQTAWDEIYLFSGLERAQQLEIEGRTYLNDTDAKRIRSLAEREVINRFTTAELHIDFTANNNINSNMDLDGVVSYLEEQLTERLEMAAEGVYS